MYMASSRITPMLERSTCTKLTWIWIMRASLEASSWSLELKLFTERFRNLIVRLNSRELAISLALLDLSPQFPMFSFSNRVVTLIK